MFGPINRALPLARSEKVLFRNFLEAPMPYKTSFHDYPSVFIFPSASIGLSDQAPHLSRNLRWLWHGCARPAPGRHQHTYTSRWRRAKRKRKGMNTYVSVPEWPPEPPSLEAANFICCGNLMGHNCHYWPLNGIDGHYRPL